MFTRMRTRLLLSNITILAITIGLIGFVVAEYSISSRRISQLSDIEKATTKALELSLYIQYNARDADAYTLGHIEYRTRYSRHAVGFASNMAALEDVINSDVFEDDERERLDQIREIRSSYDTAIGELFILIDKQRLAPSDDTQNLLTEKWKEVDDLSSQLDAQSHLLAQQMVEDARRLEQNLERRTQRLTILAITLGVVLTGILILTQVMASRALGQPLRALQEGVQQFATNKLDTRVRIFQRNEIGELAAAFNDMAATISQQQKNLVQLDVAEAARAEAEAAHAKIAAQLDTIARQRDIIREMSVPILSLNATTLVMPLIGALDTERLSTVQTQALSTLERSRATHLIVDLTGVPIVDSQVASGLLQLVQAAQLLGASVVMVGIRPELAHSIVSLGLPLDSIVTRSGLQSGIAYALGLA